jgi:hypothetical protein
MRVFAGKTAEQIAEDIVSMAFWPGYYGEICSKCHRAANVLGAHGWACSCGEHNVQFASLCRGPFERPSIGPKISTIERGVALAIARNSKSQAVKRIILKR